MQCYADLSLYPPRPSAGGVVTADMCIYDRDYNNGYGLDFARDFGDSLIDFPEPSGTKGETWVSRVDGTIYIDKGNGNAFGISSQGVENLAYTSLNIGEAIKDFPEYLGQMGEPCVVVHYSGTIVTLNQRLNTLEQSQHSESISGLEMHLQSELDKQQTIQQGMTIAQQTMTMELKEEMSNLEPEPIIFEEEETIINVEEDDEYPPLKY